MRILLVSQYFWPETFRINDLAESLHQLGHQVVVLTGKPNYPQGKIYEGYSFGGYQKEWYKQGIEVIRVPLIPRGSSSGIRLMINYFSYVFFACLYVLFCRKKFDASLTFAISPITQIYPALLYKKFHRQCRTVLWVQDLWPESVTAAGKMNSRFVYSCLDRMVRSIYRKVDAICVQSQGFIESVLDKGADKQKIVYLPNWAEDLFEEKSIHPSNPYAHLIPKGFVVMFAGNIGEAQDFDSIIQAAYCTKEIDTIKWVIIGDGRKRELIERQVKQLGLSDTVSFLGKYPVEDMPIFFSLADVLLVTLKDQPIFSLTIPSKIQSYMAFGKPIVSMLNGIGNEVISESGCGFTASAGDYKTLADNVIRASRTNQSDLAAMGDNGTKYYRTHFKKDKIIQNLLSVMS